MIKRKWFIYTVLIGLIPFFLRLMIFCFTRNVQIGYTLNEIDLISFGLILNLTNINELEGSHNIDLAWKTTQVGLSLLLLILFSAFLALAYLSEIITDTFDRPAIRVSAIIA